MNHLWGKIDRRFYQKVVKMGYKCPKCKEWLTRIAPYQFKCPKCKRFYELHLRYDLIEV